MIGLCGHRPAAAFGCRAIRYRGTIVPRTGFKPDSESDEPETMGHTIYHDCRWSDLVQRCLFSRSVLCTGRMTWRAYHGGFEGMRRIEREKRTYLSVLRRTTLDHPHNDRLRVKPRAVITKTRMKPLYRQCTNRAEEAQLVSVRRLYFGLEPHAEAFMIWTLQGLTSSSNSRAGR